MGISNNFCRVAAIVDQFSGAKLISVVKNRSVPEIQELIDVGADRLAFNRVQEAAEKFPQLNFKGHKHLIGHLQKNKVKKAVKLFDWIQSVDSLALAEKIDLEAKNAQKTIKILLQVNVADDPDKYGFSETELIETLAKLRQLTNLEIKGLMTIGKLYADEDEIRQTFHSLKELLEKIRAQNVFENDFHELSMGMSGDYHTALKEGATFVRVGSALFE